MCWFVLPGLRTGLGVQEEITYKPPGGGGGSQHTFARRVALIIVRGVRQGTTNLIGGGAETSLR